MPGLSTEGPEINFERLKTGTRHAGIVMLVAAFLAALFEAASTTDAAISLAWGLLLVVTGNLQMANAEEDE